MKTAFITGITGQDGAYLAQLLLEKGYEVHGGVRRISQPERIRLERLGIADQLHLHEFDLTEQNNIFRTLRDVRDGRVLQPRRAELRRRVVGHAGLYRRRGRAWGWCGCSTRCAACGPRRASTRPPPPRCSAWCRRCRSARRRGFHPRSPYGVAKVYGHYITMNYRESFGMHASSGILFNHESPLRGEEFVTRKITRGLARLARGGNDPVELGNMDAQARLGLRRRLRRGHVADAAAGRRRTITCWPPG